MKTFAARLKSLRERRALSQVELARLLKIHPIQISRYERGMALPSIETVTTLSRVLQVTTDELLLNVRGSMEPPTIRHATLFESFSRLDEVIDDRKDLEAVLTFLDAFVAKKQLKRMAASA